MRRRRRRGVQAGVGGDDARRHRIGIDHRGGAGTDPAGPAPAGVGPRADRRRPGRRRAGATRSVDAGGRAECRRAPAAGGLPGDRTPPGVGRVIRPKIPPELLGFYDHNVEARRQLTAMATPRDTLPAWQIEPPAPPDELLGYYHDAEAATGVGWNYLAAINFIETRFGSIHGVSTAGAEGPMQFLPSTFAAYGDGGDVRNPRDAIMAAGRYLAANGFAGDPDRAIFQYNHASQYVAAVNQYAAGSPQIRPPSATTTAGTSTTSPPREISCCPSVSPRTTGFRSRITWPPIRSRALSPGVRGPSTPPGRNRPPAPTRTVASRPHRAHPDCPSAPRRSRHAHHRRV